MRGATQPYCNTVEYGCVSLRMRLFSQNFETIKRILPGSSSPSHREGPGIEVVKVFGGHLLCQSPSLSIVIHGILPDPSKNYK